MNVSELINALQELLNEYGDYAVYVNDTEGDRAELQFDWVNIEDGDEKGNLIYIG